MSSYREIVTIARSTKIYPRRSGSSVAKRFEFADGEPKPLGLDPPTMAHQLELDVRHVLGRHGVPIAGQRFAKLQAHFRRKGYIDD